MSFIDNKINTPQDLDTYKSVIWMINVLTTDVFLIFSAAITAKIIIGEYRNRTILVMFSYPISRKKIMLSKLFLIVIFTMVCIFVSNIACILYTIILDSIVNVVAGYFSIYYIYNASLSFLGFTIMGGILSLMPFTVGMWKKSVPSTVSTAVLIAALMQPVIGHNPQVKETLIKLIIVTLIVLILTAHTVINYINNIDYADIA
jgi:ABC-type transport system involved in multi-copper enzyme maturation permease subunit